MGSRHRFRNTVLTIGVLTIVLIVGVLLIRGIVEKRRDAARDRISSVARTAGSGQATTGSDGVTLTGDDSGDQSQQGQPGEDQQNQLAPPQAPPEESGDGGIIPVEDSPTFIQIVDQNVTPSRTTPGHNMAFWAQISGTAESVSMTIWDSGGAGGAFTVSLAPGPAGETTSWSYNGTAPSVPGTYNYSTTAVASDGHSVTAAGSYVIVE